MLLRTNSPSSALAPPAATSAATITVDVITNRFFIVSSPCLGGIA
jgi:hypothetical protein